MPDDAVSGAELEAILFQIKQARADLIKVEHDAGGDLDLLGIVKILDEVVRRLTSGS